MNPLAAGGDDGVTARRLQPAAAAAVPADEQHRRAADQRHDDRHDAGDDQHDGGRQRRHEHDQAVSRLHARRVGHDDARSGGARSGGARSGEVRSSGARSGGARSGGAGNGRRRDVDRRDAVRRRATELGVTSPMLTSSTAKLTATDAAIRRRSVDARGAVETRRRAAVLHGRRPSGVVDAVGSIVVAPELAQRTGVAARTAARELVDAVDAQSAVETRAAAQRPTVVDVHVAPTSGVAECADAPETVAFVDAPTCVV